MANQIVNIDSLVKVIQMELQKTKNLTETALRKAVDSTTKEAVRTTKKRSPIKTGEYKKGWSSSITKRKGKQIYGKTLHNREHYQRTHLLQHGHEGPVASPPYPHIITDEEVEELLTNNLYKEMQ